MEDYVPLFRSHSLKEMAQPPSQDPNWMWQFVHKARVAHYAGEIKHDNEEFTRLRASIDTYVRTHEDKILQAFAQGKYYIVDPSEYFMKIYALKRKVDQFASDYDSQATQSTIQCMLWQYGLNIDEGGKGLRFVNRIY